MQAIEYRVCQCPWCGVELELTVDGSAGGQEYVEDCQICCSPILVRVQIELDGDPDISVTVERENG